MLLNPELGFQRQGESDNHYHLQKITKGWHLPQKSRSFSTHRFREKKNKKQNKIRKNKNGNERAIGELINKVPGHNLTEE